MREDYAVSRGGVVLSRQAVNDHLPKVGFECLVKRFTYTGRDEVLCGAVLGPDHVSFPRAALPLLPALKGIISRMESSGRKLSIGETKFSPREKQEEAVSGMTDHLLREESGILFAPCGQGKTVMASEIICRVGVSTCILVHEEYLADQWEAAFQMIAPHIRIGRLHLDRADTGHTHDVVIASTQSLVSKTREYSRDFFESFGLLVCDEVHMYGAKVWSTSVPMFPAKYRLGLTATPYRADGFWPLIEDLIGKVAIEMNAGPANAVVHIVKLGTQIDTAGMSSPWLDDTMKRAKIITRLSDHPGRNKTMSAFLVEASKKGRRILALAERRILLDIQAKLLTEAGIPEKDIGFYVGGMKGKTDRDEQAGKQVIFATYTKAAVGLDIPDLDVVFLLSPRADIKQATGRGFRKKKGKKKTVIMDFWDSEVDGVAQSIFARKRQYREMGCQIEE